MKMQPVVERLDGIGLATTGGALEWAALRQAPGRLPAGFAVPTGEAAGPNRQDQGVDQRVSVDFNVMLILNAASRGGVDELLDDLSVKIIGRLLGWRYPGASAPTLYAGGGLASADGSTLVWALRFTTAYHLRSLS